MRWLHISDVHGFGKNYFDGRLLKKLEKFLKDRTKCEKFDFIFITGDIANQGKIISTETTDALDKILEWSNVSKENVYIVPGNHDLRREEGLAEAVKNIVDKENPSDYINESSIERYDYLFERQDVFHQFHSNYLKREYGSKLHSYIELNKVNLLLLNTSWSCQMESGNQEGKVLVSLESLSKIENNGKLTIALGHHDLDLLEEKEKERLKEHFEELGVVVYLCGHSHQQKVKIFNNDLKQFVCGIFKTNDYTSATLCIGALDNEGKLSAEYYGFKDNDNWKTISVEETKLCLDGKVDYPSKEKMPLTNFDDPGKYSYEVKMEKVPDIVQRSDNQDVVINLEELKSFILNRSYNLYDVKKLDNQKLVEFTIFTCDFFALDVTDMFGAEEFLRFANDEVMFKIASNLDTQERWIKGYISLVIELGLSSSLELFEQLNDVLGKLFQYSREYTFELILMSFDEFYSFECVNFRNKLISTKYYELIFSELILEINDLLSGYNEVDESVLNELGFLSISQKGSNSKVVYTSDFPRVYKNAMYSYYRRELHENTSTLFWPNQKDGEKILLKQIKLKTLNQLVLNDDVNETLKDLSNYAKERRISYNLIIEALNESNQTWLSDFKLEHSEWLNIVTLGSRGLDSALYELIPINDELISDILESMNFSESRDELLQNLMKYFMYEESNSCIFSFSKKFKGKLITSNDVNRLLMNDLDGKFDVINVDAESLNHDEKNCFFYMLQMISLLRGRKLGLDTFQSYYNHGRMMEKRPYFLSIISKVKSIRLSENQYLSLSTECNENALRKGYFSKSDWQNFYESYLKWLSNGEVITKSRVGDFKFLTYSFSDILTLIELSDFLNAILPQTVNELICASKADAAYRMIDSIDDIMSDDFRKKLYKMFVNTTATEAIFKYCVLCSDHNELLRSLKTLLEKNIDLGHEASGVFYVDMFLGEENFKKLFGDVIIDGESLLRKSVDRGDERASLVYAKWLQQVHHDYINAKEMFEKLVIREYKYAKLTYARRILQDDIFAEDDLVAIELLKSMSDDRKINASEILGMYYMDPKSKYCNYEEGIFYLEKANKNGNTSVAGYLGSIYLKGIKTTRDIRKGMKYLEKALRNKEVHAMKFLAWGYYLGSFVNKNRKKAFDLFFESIAIDDSIKTKNLILDGLIDGKFGVLNDRKEKIIEFAEKEIRNGNIHANVFYYTDLYKGGYFVQNKTLSKQKFDSHKAEVPDDLYASYAMQIIRCNVSEEDFEYAIDLLEERSASSEIVQEYYAVSLLIKHDVNTEDGRSKTELKKAENILLEMIDLNKTYSKQQLANAYIRKVYGKEKVEKGIDFYRELIKSDEDTYLSNFIKLIIDEKLSDEILKWIPFMKQSQSYKTKRVLFGVYLAKLDKVYDVSEAMKVFNDFEQVADPEFKLAYAKELLLKSNLHANKDEGYRILESLMNSGIEEAFYIKAILDIRKRDFQSVEELIKSNQIDFDMKRDLSERLLALSIKEDTIQKSLKVIKKQSDRGVYGAIDSLAREHIYGLSIPLDKSKGIKMLLQNAKCDYAFSVVSLAQLYIGGIWIQKDFNKAMEYLESKVLENVPYADLLKAKIFMEKDYANNSNAKARKLIRKSANDSYENTFFMGICMKNAICFKEKDRGNGLKIVERFEASMFRDFYPNLAGIAYELEDFEISKRFFELSINDPNISVERKPYSNLFYMMRKHKDIVTVSTELEETIVSKVRKMETCVDLFNLLLYQISKHMDIEWRFYFDKVRKISYPKASIDWWGKLFLDKGNDYNEACFVLGLLSKFNYLQGVIFHKKEYNYLGDGCSILTVDQRASFEEAFFVYFGVKLI